ncbi:MAG: tRNA(fMet)-specific endonuclease VapC [Halieaceae bacterium]|jgi:tRNA(fMet)-specific endonuclease VapC
MSGSLASLLDTNSLSDLVRNPQGVVAAQITKACEDTGCTSIVVAAELRYGAIKSNPAKLAERIDMILSALETPIGPNDLLIAAHVIVNDLTAVAANVGEFSPVPELKVENWLQA